MWLSEQLDLVHILSSQHKKALKKMQVFDSQRVNFLG